LNGRKVKKKSFSKAKKAKNLNARFFFVVSLKMGIIRWLKRKKSEKELADAKEKMEREIEIEAQMSEAEKKELGKWKEMSSEELERYITESRRQSEESEKRRQKRQEQREKDLEIKSKIYDEMASEREFDLKKKENPSLRTKYDILLQDVSNDVLTFLAGSLGIKVKEKDFPFVVLTSKNNSSYLPESNILRISKRRTEEGFLGDALGEELSHFLRGKLNKKRSSPYDIKKLLGEGQVMETNTAEFFGFLGRRLLYKATQDSGKYRLLFEKGDPTSGVLGQDETLDIAKKLKTMSRSEEFLPETRVMAGRTRETVLKHQRGYKWASKLDLGKIHNWKKLFSMSDEDVIKKLFRPDPDYSGL
jgi:hypothetical protein